ncbi:hypothetical protein C8J57DRAFT_1534973 [Mycena rebaudengoi]|nr:hypothetical protein C8J57DRAFT_1534973 [Mycena rebaudengoi]
MSLPFDNSGAEGRKFPPRRPPLDRCGHVRPRQRQLSTHLAFTAAGSDLLGNLNLKRRLNLNTASAPTHMQSSPPAATISANSGLLGRTDTVDRIATTVTIEQPVSTSITDVEPWRRKSRFVSGFDLDSIYLAAAFSQCRPRMPTIIDPLLNPRRKSPERIALWPFSVKREVRASRLCFLPPRIRPTSFSPAFSPLLSSTPASCYATHPRTPLPLSCVSHPSLRPILPVCTLLDFVRTRTPSPRELLASSRRALLSPHAWRAPSLWRFSLGLWEVGGDLGRVVSRGSRRSVVRVHAVPPPPRFAPWPASGFRALCGAPALMYVAPGLSVGEVGGAHGLLFLPVASARAGGRRCALVYGVFSFPGLGA